MQKRLTLITIILICSSFDNSWAKQKPKRYPIISAPVAVVRPVEPRVYGASLWIDNLKMPMTGGKALRMDSLFVLFKANKTLSLNDVHANVVLQIHDGQTSGNRATIVDFDVATGWMLAQIKRQETTVPKPKLSHQQIVDLALQNELIDFKEKKNLITVIQKFDESTHRRGIAGEKTFHQLLQTQIKEYSDKMTSSLVKSQRKIFWKNNISMPLPLVDSCEVDAELVQKAKENEQLKLEQAFRCEVLGVPVSRSVASALKPEYIVQTGVMTSNDAFLKVPSVVKQLSLLTSQLDQETASKMGIKGSCISHWITEKQVYMKSCVEKNRSFSELYNGYHLIGFYHNQKIVYKLLKTKSFTKDSQIQIIEKMLDSTRGSVL